MEYDMPEINSKERSADKFATAAFVFGIISLFSVMCCCPFVFSAIGIVFALLSKGASEMLSPRAKTGLILSIAGMFVSLVITVFTIALPLVMYRTNPEFRRNMNNAMEQTLKQDEGLFRQLYGDDFYEQFEEFIKEDDSI